MKTYTQTVREGENMGQIPEDYDFIEWHKGDHLYPNNPETVIQKGKQILEIQEAFLEGKTVYILEYFDVPYKKVTDVGMYDGWPYWKPVPHVNTPSTIFNCGWVTWYSIYSYKIEET